MVCEGRMSQASLRSDVALEMERSRGLLSETLSAPISPELHDASPCDLRDASTW